MTVQEANRDSLGRCKMRGCNLCDARKVQLQKKWIPCEERLPNNDEDVLVQMEDESMMVDFRTASSSGWFWAEVSELPIAWQPLPQPYKKEGAENE